MKAALLSCCFISAASSVLAQDDLAAARALFIETIEKHDCAMSENEATIELPTVGIDSETSLAITSALLKEGLAVVKDKTLTLKTENCV